MVSGASFAAMTFSLLVSLGLPIAFLCYFRIRYRIRFATFGVGILVYLIFVFVLESLTNQYVIRTNVATASFLENPLAYAVYAGLAAGIFEECGRFIAFNYYLKKDREWRDGIAYGIGHGGIEAVLIGVFASLNQIINSIMINQGTIDSLASQYPDIDISALKSAMADTPAYIFAITGLERSMAFVTQIALSLLILYGIKNRKLWFFPLTILIHAVIDFMAALYQKNILNLWAFEALFLAVAVAGAAFIVKSKKRFTQSGTGLEIE